MSIIEKISKGKLLKFDKLISLYPPFLFLGGAVKISDDYKTIRLKQKLRWYNRNNNGVLFGGTICMLSDPFPALVFEKIIEGCSAWTKNLSIEYLKPAKTSVVATILLEDNDIANIRKQLDKNGVAEKTFIYYFVDKRGKNVALVSNTIYLRYKRKKGNKR